MYMPKYGNKLPDRAEKNSINVFFQTDLSVL